MVIDNLRLIDGFFENDSFNIRGILRHAVFESFKADGVIMLARLIQEDEPIKLIIDRDSCISIPVELNLLLKKEFETIYNYLQ